MMRIRVAQCESASAIRSGRGVGKHLLRPKHVHARSMGKAASLDFKWHPGEPVQVEMAPQCLPFMIIDAGACI